MKAEDGEDAATSQGTPGIAGNQEMTEEARKELSLDPSESIQP